MRGKEWRLVEYLTTTERRKWEVSQARQRDLASSGRMSEYIDPTTSRFQGGTQPGDRADDSTEDGARSEIPVPDAFRKIAGVEREARVLPG